MKKILLFALLSTVAINAQTTTVYSNDFTAGTGLSIIDNDGDTNNWGLYTGNATTASWGLTGNFTGSASWTSATGALTPDNFLITPAIAVPLASGSSTNLSFKLGATDPDFPAEKISIYVYPSTVTTAAGIIATTPVFTRTLTTANANTALSYTVTLTGVAGQSVRIALRHYGCTDQNLLYLDDLLLSQTVLSNQDFVKQNFSIYPNPANDVVTISKNNAIEIIAVNISDINGRVVKEVANDIASINISDLNAGVYFLKINTAEGSGTTKLIKN